jgi:hypothetical protein
VKSVRGSLSDAHRVATRCRLWPERFREANVLFKDAQIDGIRAGRTTRTFRRWRQPRVTAGSIYRLRPGIAVRVTAIRAWPKTLTQADARAAGLASLAALVRAVGPQTSVTTLYRVDFERTRAPVDPRRTLAKRPATGAELEGLGIRLAAMDRRTADGPWTDRVLATIAARPGCRAADLAAELRLDTATLKTRVRRLKALGLTESLEVGYRLALRGRRYLVKRRRGTST